MTIKTKRKVPPVMQLHQTECGLCCCAMVLRYYNSNETLLELREELEAGRDGLTIRQLQTLLERKGFETKIYKGTLQGLKKIKLPTIIFWSNDHFVVLERLDDKFARIVDPAIGSVKLTIEEFEEQFSSYILCAQPSDNFTPKREKRRHVWFDVLAHLLDRKLLFLQILALSIISYLLTLQIPIQIQKQIDRVLESGEPASIYRLMTVAGIIALLYGGFIWIRGAKFIILNVFLSKRLVAGTFSHLLKLPYKFFDLRSPGDLLYRINSINGVRELISTQFVSGIVDLGAFVFILSYMFWKSPTLTAIALAIFVCNLAFMIATRPFIARSIENELREQSKAQAAQVEALFSISSIKILGMEEEIYSGWNTVYREVLNRFKIRSKFQNINNTVNGLIQTTAPLAILIVSLFLFLEGRLSLGEVIAYQTLCMTFFSLCSSLFGAYTQYLLATTYLERASDINDSEIDPGPEKPVVRQLSGEIKLDNVTFSYTKHSEPVVRNVTMRIGQGEKIAIVGASGSGKSTLSKLIVGLYKPTEGMVSYDDIPLNQYDKRELSKQLGIVPQEVMLFNKSILRNITMNNESVDMERVKQVAEAAQIASEIESMPMGYHTVISEMGMNLSGGQRQRIALARALINDPKAIVLDEATSSLDLLNESKISEYLNVIGSTRIVIAHRLATIIDSDMIYVMDKGEIIESGNHEQLMAMNGVYSDLYRSQSDSLLAVV